MMQLAVDSRVMMNATSWLFSLDFLAWILGGAMCKLVTYVQGVSVAASVDSLVAVSVDR